jgi:hypothetical protein
MPSRKPTIVVTGNASDIAAVAERMAAQPVDVVLVDENASGTDVRKSADLVVFALSRDGCYSSQLKSVCLYVHDHVRATEKCLLPVGDVDLTTLAYPEIAHLPQVTQQDLVRSVREIAASSEGT